MTSTARLLVQCPDGRGITAAVTAFISERGGNLLDLEQHTDPDHGEFMLRTVLESTEPASDLGAAFSAVAERYDMRWRLVDADRPQRIAVLAGRNLHCLVDILYRASTGDLPGEVVSVISNHPDASDSAGHHDVPFHHLPVDAEDPDRQPRMLGELLDRLDPDLVVLARYMRILPPDLASRWSERMINVHHSFLPAFPGADPYRQAYHRGVKLVGATAHYVTPELDEGPIVAQAAAPVDHHQSVTDLRRVGADLERMVLADAVRAHLQDRILVKDGRTIVFR
ncbi:MAG: formyltetrahydrofolate deformylase [Phycisphaerae bacterium]|nr:formyltetrahydrofolate deformylase [Phycisphaerae bacterium]